MSRQNDALIEQAVKAVRKAGALLTDQSAVRVLSIRNKKKVSCF